MGLADYIPYSTPDVREQVDRLFSRKMLGAVLVGKFVGDYTAILSTRLLGTDLGYITGILLAVSIFIYWERIERSIEQTTNELSEEQQTWSDY